MMDSITDGQHHLIRCLQLICGQDQNPMALTKAQAMPCPGAWAKPGTQAIGQALGQAFLAPGPWPGSWIMVKARAS